MRPFAKLFETKEHGQILALLGYDDDDKTHHVQMVWDQEDKGYTIGVFLSSDSIETTRKILDKMTVELAVTLVAKTKSIKL